MRKAVLSHRRMILVAFLLMLPSPRAPIAAQDIIWKPIQGGLLYTRMETEGLLAKEMATVHVYSVDTSRYRLRFFDCLTPAEGRPLSLAQWYERTDAFLLFNVCTEDETEGAVTYLRISGRTVQSRLSQAWKGLLVSDGSGKAHPSTKIIDLQFASIGPSDLAYSDVYQQPMLLDERSEIRVEPRPNKATRVALAEDRHRNLLVFLTEKPCTLWDLARWLKGCPFSVLRAMNLGRGNAAQVLGRHPADRVYILGPARSALPLQELGAQLEDAATKQALCCVMGVVALED